MPEGHLLHRLARDQAELVGSVIGASSPQGRFADGAAAIHGRTLAGVEAYGKHLHHRFEDKGLHTHLGMQGKWIRPAAGLDRDTFHRLWGALVELMRRGVDDGRIISAPLPAADRATVAEAESRMVYKQAVCRACATPVASWTLDGRMVYACLTCQPL